MGVICKLFINFYWNIQGNFSKLCIRNKKNLETWDIWKILKSEILEVVTSPNSWTDRTENFDRISDRNIGFFTFTKTAQNKPGWGVGVIYLKKLSNPIPIVFHNFRKSHFTIFLKLWNSCQRDFTPEGGTAFRKAFLGTDFWFLDGKGKVKTFTQDVFHLFGQSWPNSELLGIRNRTDQQALSCSRNFASQRGLLIN